MNLPDYFYSKAFWESISLSTAGLLALLAAAGYLPADYVLPSAAILSGILAFLRFLKVETEVRARAALIKSKKVKK